MTATIVAMGNLGKDPEAKVSKQGAVYTTFSLAVRSRFGKDTSWFECVVFGKSAEFVKKYFQRGTGAYVTGEVRVRTFTRSDGTKGSQTEIVVDHVTFAGSGPGSNKDSGGVERGTPGWSGSNVSEDMPVDDDLPF